jgi:hypothetical protein
MLAKLKTLLAECHLSGEIVRTLAQANFDYLIQRAQEELDYVKLSNDEVDSKRRLILATRLITLARYKLENPSESVQSRPTRRRRTRSNNPSRDNQETQKP